MSDPIESAQPEEFAAPTPPKGGRNGSRKHLWKLVGAIGLLALSGSALFYHSSHRFEPISGEVLGKESKDGVASIPVGKSSILVDSTDYTLLVRYTPEGSAAAVETAIEIREEDFSSCEAGMEFERASDGAIRCS